VFGNQCISQRRSKAAQVVESSFPPKRRLNADQKRALKAASLQTFVQEYGRQAQKGVEPNDRDYDRDLEKAIKQMKPEELDKLLRDGEA
jgi:hypothetical protein